MRGENAPPPDGWVCEPHAWDAERCCPPECIPVVEVAENIELGDN